jgi:hypothetical protein
MTIEEKIRGIMLSKDLPDSEKLDRLHALIPPEAFKIDNLNQATPAQLKQLRDGLAVTDAMQEIRRADYLAKKQSAEKSERDQQETDRRPTSSPPLRSSRSQSKGARH